MQTKSGILAFSILIALFVAGNVMAVPLVGTEITVYDNEKSSGSVWYDRGESPGEDEEVEPGNATGQI